jgi:hypothetical protein
MIVDGGLELVCDAHRYAKKLLASRSTGAVSTATSGTTSAPGTTPTKLA